MSRYPFSGSYRPEDVIFLLKTIDMKPVETAEKERRIQSGRFHYSEMIGEEKLPSETYLALFQEACERNERRMAMDAVRLARILADRVRGDVTIVSLARAGTPVGVILHRILRSYFGKMSVHYSISIIRDRGIDENALLHILRDEGRSPESMVFVDGWTGKGVIARELKKSVGEFNAKHAMGLSDELYVLSDLCGHADFASSCEDYMIPSSILNSTISGLVSRSILNEEYIGKNDFHGCLYYREFEEYDLSNWFIDKMAVRIEEIDRTCGVVHIEPVPVGRDMQQILRAGSEAFLRRAAEVYNVRDVNHVKPGIGEATRVLLRRNADRVILRSRYHPDVRHLLLLAREKDVPVVVDENLPYRAAALIRDLKLLKEVE